MSLQKESFGIMDDCYFTPKSQIISWINQLLDLNVTKIQMLGSGAVYCQVVDVIHPGKVAMNKVNWKAKNQYEFINNLKILQAAFQKIGVKRYVEVEKLARAKYQDNLEFIQWLKKFFDTNGGARQDYDANQRRGHCAVDFSFAEKNVVPKTYNGSGQIIGSKNEIQPVKKTSIVPSNRIGVTETKHLRKLDSKSPNRNKEESQNYKSGANWESRCKAEIKKNKDLTLKLEMIAQVWKSGQQANSKLGMIGEILQEVEGLKQALIQEEYAENQMLNHQESENI